MSKKLMMTVAERYSHLHKQYLQRVNRVLTASSCSSSCSSGCSSCGSDSDGSGCGE